MSPRRRPFEDNNEDSRLATSSEVSSLGSSSSGTSRDGVHEGAFELPLKYTARYEFEEYYHGDPRNPFPKFNRGVFIPEAFLKTGHSKRAHMSFDPAEESTPKNLYPMSLFTLCLLHR
ncbi:hypothetical protein ACOSQ2_004757 [Xanthoceras sorbifolium]